MFMEAFSRKVVDLLHQKFLFQSVVDPLGIRFLQHHMDMIPPSIGQDSLQPDGFALWQHSVDMMVEGLLGPRMVRVSGMAETE